MAIIFSLNPNFDDRSERTSDALLYVATFVLLGGIMYSSRERFDYRDDNIMSLNRRADFTINFLSYS